MVGLKRFARAENIRWAAVLARALAHTLIVNDGTIEDLAYRIDGGASRNGEE